MRRLPPQNALPFRCFRQYQVCRWEGMMSGLSRYQSLYNNTTGSDNTATGHYALYSSTTVSGNTAVGSKALYSNTTGFMNVATGYQALYSNTEGSHNTANGYEALYSNTEGSRNTANGFHSLYSNTTGEYNTATGTYALGDNEEGDENTATGYDALSNNTSGEYNTAMGFQSLSSNISGTGNTAMGYKSLDLNTSGKYNTALGMYAYINGNYDNSTAMGCNTKITASNQIRLGNSDVTSIGGYANWTNVSDGRFKKDVQENVKGLEFIMKLRPVTYHLDMDAIARYNNTPDSLRLPQAEGLKAAELQTGFIAQEVEQAAQSLGYDFSGVDAPKNADDYYGLRYAEFVVPLVKAVQEQQEIIETQQKEIEELKKMVVKLLEKK